MSSGPIKEASLVVGRELPACCDGWADADESDETPLRHRRRPHKTRPRRTVSRSVRYQPTCPGTSRPMVAIAEPQLAGPGNWAAAAAAAAATKLRRRTVRLDEIFLFVRAEEARSTTSQFLASRPDQRTQCTGSVWHTFRHLLAVSEAARAVPSHHHMGTWERQRSISDIGWTEAESSISLGCRSRSMIDGTSDWARQASAAIGWPHRCLRESAWIRSIIMPIGPGSRRGATVSQAQGTTGHQAYPMRCCTPSLALDVAHAVLAVTPGMSLLACWKVATRAAYSA